MYELAFLLFRVKEAAQVEDDGQKEHEAGHSDDGHILFPGEGTIEILTPQSAGHIHRILYVNTQSTVFFHLAVQHIQGPIGALAVFAQLCVVPLLILLKAGESLIENRHEVQCVIGQALQVSSDTLGTVGVSPQTFQIAVQLVNQHQPITAQKAVPAGHIPRTHLV